jgi:hypothetical protein
MVGSHCAVSLLHISTWVVNTPSVAAPGQLRHL